MAGLPSFVGDDGKVQNPTMIFRLGGVDTKRLAAYGADTIMPEQVSELLRRHNGSGYDLPRAKIWLFTTTRPNELLCNCTRVIGPDGRELNTLFADIHRSRDRGRQVREYADFSATTSPDATSFVNDTGVQVGVRQTRQARGITTLRNEAVVPGTKSEDGIARSPWPIELHSGDKPQRVAARRLLRSPVRLLRAGPGKGSSSPGGVYPPSTKPSRRRASRRSASRMARRSACRGHVAERRDVAGPGSFRFPICARGVAQGRRRDLKLLDRRRPQAVTGRTAINHKAARGLEMNSLLKSLARRRGVWRPRFQIWHSRKLQP